LGTAGQGDARVRALPANTMQVVLVRVATAQRTLRIPEESLRHESTSYEALGVWLDACQPVCALFGDRGLGLEWKGTLSNSLPEEHIDKVARSTGVEVDVDVEMGFWSKIADWLREQRDLVEMFGSLEPPHPMTEMDASILRWREDFVFVEAESSLKMSSTRVLTRCCIWTHRSGVGAVQRKRVQPCRRRRCWRRMQAVEEHVG
jgi:hypothetical protein